MLVEAGAELGDLDGIAYTQGPGLAGALLVGASVARALAYALGMPAVGVHHLEGHLLSPLLADPTPEFPFVALLVSGGHTQLIASQASGGTSCSAIPRTTPPARRSTRRPSCSGCRYPGGPALARLAESGRDGAVSLPRPMLASGDLDLSFSGLKTAVLTLVRREAAGGTLDDARRADIAREFQHAVADVLVAKAIAALGATGHARLVVAGGVGANRELRARLVAAVGKRGGQVFFPELEFCTDNGAMIALVGALRLSPGTPSTLAFSVRPRWDLSTLPAA